MQREDESLSTRDLAGTQRGEPVETAAEPAPEDVSPAEQDARFDRRPADADAQAGDSGQATADGPAEPEVSATRATPIARVVAPRTSTRPARSARRRGVRLPAPLGEIQTRFVDDPRQAVEDADALVAGVMQRIAEGFAQARDGLEGQWSRGEDVGTEELRVALQRYRAFFRRLLSA